MADWKGYALVVRHAVTVWDADHGAAKVKDQPTTQPKERITGWIDLPLRPEGMEEALATAQKLQGFPIDGIATSPLQRCQQMAKAIQQGHPQVKIQPVRALLAWNTGLFSGQLASAVQSQLDAAVKNPNTPIPQGETFAQFVQRFLPTAWQLVEDPRLLAIVTHGMNIEVLVKYAQTGSVKFSAYSGVTAAAKPGEAVFITPTGVEEVAA